MTMTVPAASRWTQTERAVSVSLTDGTNLEFALEGGMLLGLTQATIDGLPLIAPDSARLPHVEARDGWTVTGYRLTGVKEESGGVVLEAEVLGNRPGGGMRRDMYQFQFVHTPQRKPESIGSLRWHLSPESLTVGPAGVRQNTYHGFSYRYEFALTHAFHWVLDAGTWELGADPEGVTVFSQHMAAIGGPLEQTLSRSGKGYTSAETFPKGGGNNADVFQDYANDPNDEYVLPIQAQLRGAGGALHDTQFKSNGRDDGILFCFYAEPGYYRTLLEWLPDAAGIGHMDQQFFPKTLSYTTPAKSILAARVPGLTRTEALNRWTDVYDHVSDVWRGEVGVPKVTPVPGFGLDSCGGAGEHIGYPPADVFARWEARMDWLQEHGFQTIFIAGFGNHMGHEKPFVNNMCTPIDYHVHARYGGPEAFRKFCDAAHAHDLKVVTWIGAPYLFSEAIKKHPEWIVRYESGTHWDGNYGVLTAASLRRGFSGWVLDELRYLKDLGLDTVFFDSYHNLWALPIDYGQPDLVPNFPDLMALHTEISKLGLETWVESFSPFGLTRAGYWPTYAATPELNYGTHYGASSDNTRFNDFTNGNLNPAIYFRMMANGAPLSLGVMELDNLPFEGPISAHIPAEIGPMNRAYNILLPAMKVRTLREDGGVEWLNPATGERTLFGTRGSVSVPEGFRAEPVYGADRPLGAGTHSVAELTAFRLIQEG